MILILIKVDEAEDNSLQKNLLLTVKTLCNSMPLVTQSSWNEALQCCLYRRLFGACARPSFLQGYPLHPFKSELWVTPLLAPATANHLHSGDSYLGKAHHWFHIIPVHSSVGSERNKYFKTMSWNLQLSRCQQKASRALVWNIVYLFCRTEK